VRIAIVGNFGLYRKATMASRAVPIAQELANRGHALTLVLPAEAAEAADGPVSASADSPRLVSVAGRLPIPLLGHLVFGARLSWQALRFRPDVLYAFKPKAYAGLALLLFWVLRRLGLVHALLALDTDDWEGEGGWADREPGPWWLRQLVIWQERWCMEHADVVTVASRELERLATAPRSGVTSQEAAGEDGDAGVLRPGAERAASDPVETGRRRVVYAPNAASPSSPGWNPGDGHAARATLGLADTPLVLAYTRFVEFDPRRLVDLLTRIRVDVPLAHLLVVGQGLRGEEQIFAGLVQKRGLAAAVHAIGWVQPQDLPAFFAAADVAAYLLDDTLLNRTKCPMKLVDLLLAGVAVVADDVGQAREYVVDCRTGYLIPAGNVDAMAERIASLLRDPCARHTLGHAARASMLAHWTWHEQATRIAAAFERGLGGRG